MCGIPRTLELILALIGLVGSLPLLLIAAVLIRITSPGPVLFKQERVGRFGKPFTLLKFRSMGTDNNGPQVTARNDSRITMIGRILRKTKLDELPELWNVARGDLSLVGPRPEVPKYVNLKDPLWRRALESRPGITDPVTLKLRNEEELLSSCEGDPESFYLSSLQPYKLLGYAEFLERRGWQDDIRVLLRSVVAVAVPSQAPPPGINEIKSSLLRT